MSKDKSRHGRAAIAISALGAAAIGLGVLTAAPALAGPAGEKNEIEYLRTLNKNGAGLKTEQNLRAAVELGYVLCVMRQVGPEYLNPNSFVLAASVMYLCSSMEPPGPTEEGKLALATAQADLARIQNRMSGVNLGYYYHD